jgi:hypothetical protein
MMNEQQIQDVMAHFTRPWSERRGIEMIDRIAEVFLVRVSLDELADILAAQATESQRDVLGRQVEISGAFILAYQLVGQPWSVMVEGFHYGYSQPFVLQPNKLAQLSNHLQQPIIRLEVSDSSGMIGYDLFENGELVEYFRGGDAWVEPPTEFEVQPQQYLVISHPSVEIEGIDLSSLISEQTAYLWSRRRQVTAEEIGNVWRFADQLLIDYDAYDPALDDRYFLGESSMFPSQGDRHQVQNPGVTMILGYDDAGNSREVTAVPDLVRVDYFRFEN